MIRCHVLAWLTAFCVCGLALAETGEIVKGVREIRLRGELDEARSLAEQVIDSGTADARTEFALHLELARIHDRVGLHQDTRPVAAALKEIQIAAEIADSLDFAAKAHVELSLADYHYRAEMAGRKFPLASLHAQQAIDMFRQLDDKHSEADAVHRLGLIYLQRRELHIALELFDESLQLDRAGGERPFFRGEYERHVGFVFALQDNVRAALPFFERSLQYRIQAGAIDASLFAAVSLAATLVELGKHDEARPHVRYALEVAERIDSPVGRSRAERVLARITQE